MRGQKSLLKYFISPNGLQFFTRRKQWLRQTLICHFCSILREASALALSQRGLHVAEAKADRTPVTVVDRQVEELLIRQISARYPNHQILSEESGLHARVITSEFSWALDPIDGTRAFASGLPVWGVSAGVLHNGEPWAGGFAMPVTGELYWGTAEQAYYQDSRLAPLDPPDPDSILIFLAVPSDFQHHFEVKLPRIRSLGSTAAHLAYVATGAALGMITNHTSLWDIAGVLPMAQAVGVQLVYFSGRPFIAAELMDGASIQEPLIAAHPAALPAIRKYVRLISA
jgi:fructose-1,6-bisphosphatase/inositol monophosphatase family enzyme